MRGRGVSHPSFYPCIFLADVDIPALIYSMLFILLSPFVLAFTVLGICGIVWFNRWMDRRGKAKKDQAA